MPAATDLQDALDLLAIAMPARSYPGTGGLWFGANNGMADATFEDWGLARAVAIILNAAHEGRLIPATDDVAALPTSSPSQAGLQ